MRNRSNLILAISELILAVIMTHIIGDSQKNISGFSEVFILLLNFTVYGISGYYFGIWWKMRIKKSRKMRVIQICDSVALVEGKNYILLN